MHQPSASRAATLPHPLTLSAAPLLCFTRSYAFTGITGCVACALAAWALIKKASLKPAYYAFLFSLLSVLACLGLSIYLLTKSAAMGMEWW